MTTKKAEKGDWVLFMSGGKPVIGVVLQITPRIGWRSEDEYCTTEGVVSESRIIEVRPETTKVVFMKEVI